MLQPWSQWWLSSGWFVCCSFTSSCLCWLLISWFDHYRHMNNFHVLSQSIRNVCCYSATVCLCKYKNTLRGDMNIDIWCWLNTPAVFHLSGSYKLSWMKGQLGAEMRCVSSLENLLSYRALTAAWDPAWGEYVKFSGMILHSVWWALHASPSIWAK